MTVSGEMWTALSLLAVTLVKVIWDGKKSRKAQQELYGLMQRFDARNRAISKMRVEIDEARAQCDTAYDEYDSRSKKLLRRLAHSYLVANDKAGLAEAITAAEKTCEEYRDARSQFDQVVRSITARMLEVDK